jgi:hypothetical protein
VHAYRQFAWLVVSRLVRCPFLLILTNLCRIHV